jgi:methionine-rich copper-binding protein CopC
MATGTAALAAGVLGLAVLTGALVLRSASLAAHAVLERSIPADGTRLGSPPTQVELFFGQHLVQSHIGTFAIVYNAAGQAVSGEARLDPQDRTHLSVPLHGTLDAGPYVVFWKTTSDEDGGVTLGTLAFAIGQTPVPTALQAAVTGQVLVPDDARSRALAGPVMAKSSAAPGYPGVAAGVAAGLAAGSLLTAVVMRRRRGRPRGTRTSLPRSNRR